MLEQQTLQQKLLNKHDVHSNDWMKKKSLNLTSITRSDHFETVQKISLGLTVVEQFEVHSIHPAEGRRGRKVAGLRRTKQLQHQRQ